MRAPWDEVEVRKAVAHAINREDLIAATQGRAGDPLDYLISPIMLAPLGSEDEVEDALASVPTYEFDVEKAREALAESSVPDGFEGEILTTATYAAVTEVIAAQLGEVGIDLSIRSVSDEEYNAALFGPAEERPLTFTETGACSPDPSWDAIWLGDSVLNIASWTPGDIEDLLAEGVSSQDPADRLDVYTQILTRLGEEVPYVPVYEEGATYASMEYGMADFGSFWMNGPWALNLVTE
jgi:peptide/nickel transport system substrate-binding protein